MKSLVSYLQSSSSIVIVWHSDRVYGCIICAFAIVCECVIAKTDRFARIQIVFSSFLIVVWHQIRMGAGAFLCKVEGQQLDAIAILHVGVDCKKFILDICP